MNFNQQGQRPMGRSGIADNRFTHAQLNAGGVSMNTGNFQPPSLSQRTIVGPTQVAVSNRPSGLVSRNPPGQLLSGRPATNDVQTKISSVPPENGKYTITQIHSPTEFYGYSAKREFELNTLRTKLEEDYSIKATDSAYGNFLVIEGEAYVIQKDDKCERVIVKSRDSDTKVRVQLVDRGDEVVLDTSELLPLNPMFEKIPVFAQRFCLDGYDELRNSATMTKNFKQLILNKTVDIKLTQPNAFSGSYIVEVSIEGHVVNKLPLGNVTMNLPPALVTALASPTSRSAPTNPQNMPPVTSHVFTNSSRHTMQSATQQSGPRDTTPLNLNNPLGTNAPRTQPGRFGDQTNQSSSRFDNQENQSTHGFSAQTSQQPSRFATPAQQNPPQKWNNDSNTNNNTGNFGGPSGSNFPRNAPSSNSYNQSGMPTEQKRSFDNSGFGRDFQNDQSNRTNNFPRSNDNASNNENPSANRNTQGFSSNRWHPQNNNNNENERSSGPSSSDNFSGSSSRGFSNRGSANQGPDRSSHNRFQSNDDSNNDNRQNSRGGFGNSRGQPNQGPDRSSYNRFQSNDDSNNDNRQTSRGGFGNSRGQPNQGPDRPSYNRYNSNDDSNNENRQNSRGGFGNSRGQPNQGPDRSSYNRFQNNEDSNNENRQNSRGGFGNSRGQPNQGSDRSSYNRYNSNEDSNNDNRQNFRDGFSNNRGRQESSFGSNDFGRRYDDNNNRRDNQSRGDFSDRGGRGGGRGSRGRGGFDNRGQGEFRQSFDNKESSNNFRDATQPFKATTSNVEVGTSFPDNVVLTDTFEYVISHVEKPDEFYIQLTSNENDISSASEVLQRESNECPAMELSSLKMNGACLAKHSDECWYRAVIISTSAFQPKVRFIDFGDTTTVTGQSIRQIAKKHCSKPPYAYRCTFADIIVSPNADVSKIIEQCVQKKFQGKIVGQTPDKRFILQSDQFQKILIDTNSIKVKVEVTLPRHSCSIVQVEKGDRQFFVQDDPTTVETIATLVEKEWESSPMLSIDEVKELPADAMLLALFEEAPYRAVIRHEENENDVKVYFVDYGNTDISAKTSLKRCSDELSKYANQAKRCQLFGIPSAKLDEAFASLEEKTDSESIEYSLVHEKDQCLNVLIYIEKKCFNEQFGCDLSTVAEILTPAKKDDETPTSVEKKEEPLQTAEASPQTTIETKEETIPITASTTEEVQVEPTKEEGEEQVTASTTRRGLFTHMEKDRAYVYIQMIPDSEEKLEKINEIINKNTENPKPISDGCQPGDLVIARFTDDETYYRARIQSFSAESNSYSVYFIDFGNIDENVSSEYVLSYPDELKVIEPQARAYLLNEINGEQWINVIHPFLEAEKLNGEVEFDLIDEQSSIIHLHGLPDVKVEEVEEVPDEPVVDEKHEMLSGYISAVDNDCFYFQLNSSGIDEMNDVLKTLTRENRTDGQWSVGDRCLVVDNEDRLYRGEIVAMTQVENNDEYTVKCIDYGSTQSNRNGNQLFLFPDEEIFQREPLTHQCRLQSIDNDHQREEVEKIPSNELVRIEIENDRNASCWCVNLYREEQIEEESDTDKKEEIVASDAGQVEHRDEQNSMSVISNNQTIDFGEHDPSTTTIQDETQNEPVPAASN